GPGLPGAPDEPIQRIRVLLAEDQAMIRQALAALLSFEHDIEVVAQVGRGDEVVPAAAEHDVDVALLDIEMPGMDGLTAASELRRAKPEVKIVILTTFGRPGFLRRAMESGVSAFLIKDSPADKLAETVRRVLVGGRVIDPDLAAAALAEGVSPNLRDLDCGGWRAGLGKCREQAAGCRGSAGYFRVRGMGAPSSSKARRWTGVGSVSLVMCLPVKVMACRSRVDRCSS